MKCDLKNRCGTPNRCCHFCKQKNCWKRCNDNHKGCQWFVNEKDEENPQTIIQAMSDTTYYQIFKNKENKQ